MVKHLCLKSGITDDEFDSLYPPAIRKISALYFTPISVAVRAAAYLSKSANSRVLDIGSGAGKFCIAGALHTQGEFIGVEYRKSFWLAASHIVQRYNLNHVGFIHSNIDKIDFAEYDAFYFFNSFYENVHESNKINTEVDLNPSLYLEYSDYVKAQLDQRPIKTKVVTYFSYTKEIPPSYKLVATDFEGKLKMWEKSC